VNAKFIKQMILRRLSPFSKDPGPPPHIKAFIGPINQWTNPETLRTLVKLGLATDDQVLDFGCGAGRLAEALWHFGVRRYVGIDIHPEVIEYARTHFGFPGFTFSCYNAFNSTYNPGGERSASPEILGEPTIAVCISLFTHLLSGEASHLIAIFSRKPSIKKCLISCYCAEDERLLERLGARVEMSRGVWVKRKTDPHAIVVYQPKILTEIAACCGWSSRIEKGCWREKSPDQALRESIPYQDYLILTR
jgi:SAM-dependent methyltransferase